MPLKEWIADDSAHDDAFYKKIEAVITTDTSKLNDLSTEEVLSIGEREALDVLWFVGMSDSGAPPSAMVSACVSMF